MSTVEVTQEADVIVVGEEDNVLVTIQVGQAGPPGIQGPEGPPSTVPGPPGAPGPPGHTIRYGPANPTTATGYDGDFYINTTTHFLFGPKETGTWPPGTSLIGPQGIPGNTVLYGASDPTAGQGVDGNFYINTTTHFMFGPKAAGAWPAGISLIGPQGIQGIQGIQGPQGIQGIPGNTVLYGAGPPSSVLGVDGNFYINTSVNYIYGPKAGGSWPAGTSLVGPQGSTGPQGPAGTLTCFVSDTPPAGAADNTLWWESDTGIFYLRYNDGTSTQWVIACPTPDTSQLVSAQPQSFTAPQQAQARQNIFAAPLDALAFNGMQINGSMDVRQLATDANFPVDEWHCSVKGGAWGQSGEAPSGLTRSVKLTVTTATPTLAATDSAILYLDLEGQRFSRMAWGTAFAQPLTVAFWSKIHRPGTYSIAIGNNDQTSSYVTTFTHSVADVWEYKVVTIPACMTGQWGSTSSDRGLYIMFTMAAGASYTATPNVWASGIRYAATGATNGIAATTDTFQITGVVLLPGVEAPPKERHPFIMRPPEQELLLCMRHLQFIPGSALTGQAQQTTAIIVNAPFLSPMRPTPVATLVKTSFGPAPQAYDVMVGGNWFSNPAASWVNPPAVSTGSMTGAIAGFTGLPVGGAVSFNTTLPIIMLDARI